MTFIEDQYLKGNYYKNNPSWGQEDGIWKANFVVKLLGEYSIKPNSLCDVGCGTGRVLSELKNYYPSCEMFGFDISPNLSSFWQSASCEIKFTIGDFFDISKRKKYDVVTIFDVVEHLRDPFSYLEKMRSFGKYFIFHFPLDLSAYSIAREKSLLSARVKQGHIHYYTKNLAISLLEDCGYKIMLTQYSGAFKNAPNRTLKTKIASFPRQFLSMFSNDFSALLLGGETLIILAKSK